MKNRLAFYRQQKNLTQVELAKRAGISEQYYQRLEYQKHEPKVSTAQKLAKVLGVDVNKLFPLDYTRDK